MRPIRSNKPPADKQRYLRLWAAIIENAKRKAASESLPLPTQAIASKTLGVDAAALSRLLSGKDLPQNQALLFRAARFYGASDSQTRGLLALASAVAAEADGAPDLANLYRRTFLPLFEENAFAKEINTLQNVAFHAMLEIGISRSEALAIAGAIDEEHNSEVAIMGMILTKLASASDPATASAIQKIGQLVTLGKTFAQVAAIDLNVPWSGPLTHIIKHQMDGQVGVRWGTWTRIPNIAITSLKLDPSRVVTDRKHQGFEFLILIDGSGIFEMKAVGQVKLGLPQRQIIAYRPTHLHRFIAGPHGASLYVVSYLRSADESHDPIDELIKATEHEGRVVYHGDNPR